MCSFDVQYVDVAQKMSKQEGGKFGHFCNISCSPICSFFELHLHIVRQKNTFLIQNLNSESKNYIYSKKFEKSQIFFFDHASLRCDM